MEGAAWSCLHQLEFRPEPGEGKRENDRRIAEFSGYSFAAFANRTAQPLGSGGVFGADGGRERRLILVEEMPKGGAAGHGFGRYVAVARADEPRERRGCDDAGRAASSFAAAEFKIQGDGGEEANRG